MRQQLDVRFPRLGLSASSHSGIPVVPIPIIIRPGNVAIYPGIGPKLQAISQKFMNRKESE
jgi:hypothetical protein